MIRGNETEKKGDENTQLRPIRYNFDNNWKGAAASEFQPPWRTLRVHV